MKTRLLAIAISLAVLSDLSAGPSISLSSPAFQSGGEIPATFTCNGANVSPELRIGEIPGDAKSLVLIVDDPDAPSGLFTHWLLWNIDPHTSALPQNGVPAGAIQGTNDFSKRGYGGPCPPSGTHRYFFKVFALDSPLQLKAGSRRNEVDAAMRGHIISQAELMGRYSHR